LINDSLTDETKKVLISETIKYNRSIEKLRIDSDTKINVKKYEIDIIKTDIEKIKVDGEIKIQIIDKETQSKLLINDSSKELLDKEIEKIKETRKMLELELKLIKAKNPSHYSLINFNNSKNITNISDNANTSGE